MKIYIEFKRRAEWSACCASVEVIFIFLFQRRIDVNVWRIQNYTTHTYKPFIASICVAVAAIATDTHTHTYLHSTHVAFLLPASIKCHHPPARTHTHKHSHDSPRATICRERMKERSRKEISNIIANIKRNQY